MSIQISNVKPVSAPFEPGSRDNGTDYPKRKKRGKKGFSGLLWKTVERQASYVVVNKAGLEFLKKLNKDNPEQSIIVSYLTGVPVYRSDLLSSGLEIIKDGKIVFSQKI